jgi:hypothetical protein
VATSKDWGRPGAGRWSWENLAWWVWVGHNLCNNLVKRSAKDQKKENGTGLMIACELGADGKLFLVVATYSTLQYPLLPSHAYIYI